MNTNSIKSFDLEQWRKGKPITTRGGSFPVIASIWDGVLIGHVVLIGYVGLKEIQWNDQGQNLVREEYGYDLFMA